MMTNLLNGAHVANKLFSTIARIRLLLVMFLTLTASTAWGQTTTTYTFSSKSWAASPANWTSGIDGNQMQSGRGIQVTTGASGANATSPKSFTNVSKIVVTYSTNASAGAGTIKIKIGSNTEVSQNVTKTGGTTDRTLTYNFSPNQTGSVKVTVTCSTNSIYLKSIAITEAAATVNHTVTWNVNGEVYETTKVTEGSKPTFPATPSSCDATSNTFYGWATATWDGKIDNISEKTIYTSANNMPAVNGAVTYYAVFAEATTTGGGDEEKEFSFNITTADFNTTSYAANNNEKTSTAKASDGSTMEVKWTSYQVMLQSSTIQWQKNSGYIYNSTDLGTITSIDISSTDGTFTTYYGTSEQPSSGTTVGNGYFQIKVGSATGKTSKVTITFTKTTQGAQTTTYSDYITSCSTETSYSVTLHTDGGTINAGNVTDYAEGEGATLPTNVTKTGYTFAGWYDNSALTGTPVTTIGTNETGDKEFWAKWTINQYTVTLNPNYPDGKTGTFKDNGGNTINDNLVQTYDYNTASMSLTDLYQSIELEGYQFNGWYSATSGGSKWTSTGTITSNVTVYAQWSKLYTITHSENGTTTTPIRQPSTSYTLPTELSAGSCQDDTKELVGWSTVAIPNPEEKPTSNFYELGETVTLTADQTTFYAVFATADGGGVENVVATLSFESTAQRTTFTTSQQVWTQNGITLTNNKASSTNNVGDYSNPARFYKSSKITVTAPENITKIVFTCNTEEYATSLAKSIGDADLASGTIVTLILDGTSDSYEVTLSDGQVRMNSLTVTYTTGSGTSYSDYSTVCEAIPDPEWGGAVINHNSIKVDCGSMTKLNAADPNGPATISFPAATNHTLTYDITVTASEGFLVSTNKTDAAKYGVSVTVSPNKTGDNAGKITQNVYVVAVAPAMSDENFTGTITLSGKQLAENQVIDVTADVTCTTYTLTLDDRGTETTAEYYAGASVPKPEDPTGVCTDPINYVFDGWSLDPVTDENITSYEKVTFPFNMPAGKTTLYAVYRYVEDGGADSGDYVKVTENLDDYSGDYLFVYETGNVAFDGGRNNVDDELDATSNTIEVTIDNNTIASNATTDAAKFTIAKVDGGYSIQSASGYYIGRSATSNGLSTNETYSANYDLNTITDYKTIKGKGGCILKYNNADNQKRFRYYQSDQEAIALYRKAASYLYTTSPVCGPHVEITSDKDIYITSGFANGRNTVIAQKKITFAATRLKPSAGGAAPSIKVPAADITLNGSKTDKVKIVDITQNIVLQDDGITYAGTGEITVSYTPTASDIYEDINVQLRAEHNTGSDVSLDAFTVHARSLPEEFIIVAKQGDKWYALNGDMSGSKAQPANGQVVLDNTNEPTKATYAPCNTIYTFNGMPDGSDKSFVRFIGLERKHLWAASAGNTGIQNNAKNPTGDATAYNWTLYTADNAIYQLGNKQNGRLLGLNAEKKFGMYSSAVQDIRILPYEAKCLYNYAPSNLKVSVLKGTYVTLTWDAVAGATKYQYSTNGTTWTDAGTDPTVTINGLTGATEYTYYIRAYHEDAGVSQECIDYAEITFTTADCDDVPTDITYSADMNSITVSWTAAAPTATITYNTKEDGTGGGDIINNATSPYKISGGLDKNTTYYIQILAGGTCASPIIPVKTEDVEVDIVEWDPQGIIVDINTDETVGVTLENEVSYGSGLGSLAEDLFFSKYFEGSGSLKMIAIYNGTGKNVDLSEYRIDRGSNGDATNISKTYDLSQLGIIKQGQEIIFYSWPLTSEYSYSCSQSFLDSKVQESGLDANPRWILCDAKTHNGIEFEAMDFSGNDPLLLYKSSELIDVFGVSTEQESPASTQICSGRSDQAWSADGVTNMDYGKTTEDFPNGEIPHGVNVDDETITAYTARVIMFRKNTVVSGKNAVTKNTTTFATFAEEWEARQVCMSGDDGDLTCAAYQELGTFDYSDYYTKYETMGDERVFDENARNADGTVTIPITDLYKHACSNIRVKLSNEGGEVLSDREYKVPIMITTTQGTDGQAFLALQENLATVEVDGEGNPTGNKTNLTLEQVREICKTCDVVVRDNATLTKVTDGTTNDHPQVHDVIVYEGASIVIPDGDDHNYTINSLSLRRKGDEVASAQVKGTGKFVLPADVPVTLSMRIDANNWHWFTLPYDCDIADVTWSDGTEAKYNTDWFLMYYDGESRSNQKSNYESHWKVYNGTTIEAGKGYIIGITGNLAHPNYTFELHFPMAQEVLTDEQKDKTVALNAWGVKSDNKPNNLGWNLVGNPYLNYYKTADEYSLAGLPLIHYINTDPVTGEWNYENSGSIPYVVTPIDGGWYEYRQELASEVNMMPFTAYFVQVGDPSNPDHIDGKELNASFEANNRGKKSILHRAPNEVEENSDPAIVAISLTNAKGESDKTTLLIADRFTSEYEMNADFFKWFGDYYTYYTKPVLYTVGADQGKRAFNALNEELATQPVALGMYAAQAGEYTFTLNQKYDLSRVEEVWLYDATENVYTNLMQQDYTFSTTKVNGEGRFSLSVKMMPELSTEIENIKQGNIWATTRNNEIIVNGLSKDMQLWIYDATGKLLHSDRTTNYQHSYGIPQTGAYFIRVHNNNEAQTIAVVVE